MKRKVSCNLIDRIITVTIICSFGISLCSCSSITADFDGQRFGKTKKITVLVDSTVEGNSDVDINDSDVSKYIHDRVLDECNIDIEFVDSDNLDIVLGLVADISYTDEYNDIVTYYRMGDIVNLYPYLKDYSSELTFLTSQFDGFETCSYIGNQNEIWCITPKINNPQSRITFIRKDWLDKLGLDVPANIAEFHNCLVAFRDNADVLLGDEANKMIPFFIDSEPNISAKPVANNASSPRSSNGGAKSGGSSSKKGTPLQKEAKQTRYKIVQQTNKSGHWENTRDADLMNSDRIGTTSKQYAESRLDNYFNGGKAKTEFQGYQTRYQVVPMDSYDTGGYTGEWNDKSGKLAFLHQKELVLNQKDTKNTLAAVKIASGIISSVAGLGSNILNNLIAGREISNILTNNNRNADNSVQQKVEISATFPSVQSSQEIEKAFNNLVNAASQRAAGNRRTY